MPDIEKPSPWAISERGKRLQHTEAEVDAALRLLVVNGGSPKATSKMLTEEGMPVNEKTIQWWRDNSFPMLYRRLRKELGREVGEQIAGKALERALQADEAEQAYIAAAIDRVDEVEPNHLAKNALALANAKATNIEKAQVLRHEPNEIVETRDVGDIVGVLERLGVAEKREAITAEVVEEEDVD